MDKRRNELGILLSVIILTIGLFMLWWGASGSSFIIITMIFSLYELINSAINLYKINKKEKDDKDK